MYGSRTAWVHLRLLSTAEKTKSKLYMEHQVQKWQREAKVRINLLMLGVKQQMWILLIDMDLGMALIMLLFIFITYMVIVKS